MVTVAYSHTETYRRLKTGEPIRPYTPVRLEYGSAYFDTWALIDSGADITMFHSSWMTVLGLHPVAAAVTALVQGVGGPVLSWEFDLHLMVVGTRFPARAAFSDGVPRAFGLLGRRDFFQAFQVGFDEAAQRVLLEPRSPVE